MLSDHDQIVEMIDNGLTMVFQAFDHGQNL